MQVHIPDPNYTGSERARASFRLAFKISLGFVVFIWLIDVVNWALDLELARLGIQPRRFAGLPGILLAPLLHGGPFHLAANSLPLLVLGTGMLYLYPSAALKVLPAIYLGTGAAVWLFAERGLHIGSSGLIYGLLGYVFAAGVIRLDRRAIAASLLVAFLYGSMVWGVLPIQPGISWESHLAGAIIGLAMAVALRRLDVLPRKRYSWEGEDAEPGDEAHDLHGERAMTKPLGNEDLSASPGERVIDKPELPAGGITNENDVLTEVIPGEMHLKRGTGGKFEVFSDEHQRIGGTDRYPSPMTYLAMAVGF